MSNTATTRVIRGWAARVLMSVTAVAAIGTSAGSAQVSCPPTAKGVSHPGSVATVPDSHVSQVCPLAYGQPVGGKTGRKVG
jgi:hypothetical protein